jgi:hypothetical protein
MLPVHDVTHVSGCTLCATGIAFGSSAQQARLVDHQRLDARIEQPLHFGFLLGDLHNEMPTDFLRRHFLARRSDRKIALRRPAQPRASRPARSHRGTGGLLGPIDPATEIADPPHHCPADQAEEQLDAEEGGEQCKDFAIADGHAELVREAHLQANSY